MKCWKSSKSRYPQRKVHYHQNFGVFESWKFLWRRPYRYWRIWYCWKRSWYRKWKCYFCQRRGCFSQKSVLSEMNFVSSPVAALSTDFGTVKEEVGSSPTLVWSKKKSASPDINTVTNRYSQNLVSSEVGIVSGRYCRRSRQFSQSQKVDIIGRILIIQTADTATMQGEKWNEYY